MATILKPAEIIELESIDNAINMDEEIIKHGGRQQ